MLQNSCITLYMFTTHIDQTLAGLAQELPSTTQELEAFRLKYLGKKGLIPALYGELKNLDSEAKRAAGAKINELKNKVNALYAQASAALLTDPEADAHAGLDLGLPPAFKPQGSLHPLTVVTNEVIEIFARLGFTVSTGPEIVDEWSNFTALNFPENHPARDMQDTFFVENLPGYLLRTHTSGVQVQELLKGLLPVRTISPGMVFRRDSDATHSPFFHQVEGLYVDQGVSFADLKQVLFHFVNAFFGEGTDFRLRPSYFPFTEPSAEMDIAWNRNGIPGWMEIMGCGMVDPAVLANCGVDPERFSGFAFGIGVERLAMLRYGIADIRVFYENDLRFITQFTAL